MKDSVHVRTCHNPSVFYFCLECLDIFERKAVFFISSPKKVTKGASKKVRKKKLNFCWKAVITSFCLTTYQTTSRTDFRIFLYKRHVTFPST
jgi:hypothetical protein